jgi:peptidoglycan/LPS O-acetylase OafA/YrhL
VLDHEPRRGFRPDIEGLRAVAVLAVVLYHAGVPGLPGGYVGVDVFFVVSGFLITDLLWREVVAQARFGWPASTVLELGGCSRPGSPCW